MIVVKIELHSALTGKITEIGKMIVANHGTSKDPRRGSYAVKLGRRGVEDLKAIWRAPQREGDVRDYPRAAYSVWVLVARALKAVGIEKWDEFREAHDVETPTQARPKCNDPCANCGKGLAGWTPPLCADCTPDEGEETPCPKREDGIHCVHWYDGDHPCCACGDNSGSSAENAQ